MKYCVHCGTAIEEDKTSCPNCGKAIDSLGATAENAVNTRYCTKCGAPVHVDAVICPKCGCSIGKESSIWGILALIFGLMGGWLGLVLGIVGLPRSKSKSDRQMCIAGIVLSCVWIVAYVIMLVLFIVLSRYAPVR